MTPPEIRALERLWWSTVAPGGWPAAWARDPARPRVAALVRRDGLAPLVARWCPWLPGTAPCWTDKQGRTIPIAEMSDTHLTHTIAMLVRQVERAEHFLPVMRAEQARRKAPTRSTPSWVDRPGPHSCIGVMDEHGRK